jgi:predicted MFS family arabinose efflux permease
LLISDLLCGIFVLLLAGLMFAAPARTDLMLGMFFIVSVIMAVTRSFFRPAFSAIIPEIVPADKIANANSLYRTSLQISLFIGQGLGGVLFRILGAPLLFLVDGLSYLFAAGCAAAIPSEKKIEGKKVRLNEAFAQFSNDLIEGFRYIRDRSGLKYVCLTGAFVNFFMAPFVLLLPFYVEDILKARTDWYGFLVASFGAGTILGNQLVGSLKLTGKLRSKLIVSSLLLHSTGAALLGFSTNRWAALLLFMSVGTLNGFINTYTITIMQLSTPNEIRGRVFGLFATFVGAMTPVAFAIGSISADLAQKKISLIYAISGGIQILLSSLVVTNPQFRDYLAYEQPRPQAVETAMAAGQASRPHPQVSEEAESL